MKKKLLILTLCFTLVFSGLNYKKSYADGGLISLPMLGVVSALAVSTGIIINSNDDLVDVGRMFYDYVDKHNSLTWTLVQGIFSSSVALSPNNFVSVGSDFLDIVKGFFDDVFDKPFDITSSGHVYNSTSEISYGLARYPLGYITQTEHPDSITAFGTTFNKRSALSFGIRYVDSSGSVWFDLYYNYYYAIDLVYRSGVPSLTTLMYSSSSPDVKPQGSGGVCSASIDYSFPYGGGYQWDNSKLNDDNSISLPVPGDLGSLVGQNKDTFWDNTDSLVGQGGLTLPGVDSPSISVDSSINTFPSVDSDVPDVPDVPGVDSPSVPNDGIWATIKDFIIGLVVPGDTYWTDTWGGLYNNFTNSFPMVDMDGFNDLVTGEKKFPNIDINIMGVNGRVVNGDVINSIVDWLRPIIAGFMMLCLMLFNYRKIYKLIRNSEPFGGIASGTSDFSTGISEYNKEPVIKAVDMASEYRSWKENGGK